MRLRWLLWLLAARWSAEVPHPILLAEVWWSSAIQTDAELKLCMAMHSVQTMHPSLKISPFDWRMLC
jgi:hypothetical protein